MLMVIQFLDNILHHYSNLDNKHHIMDVNRMHYLHALMYIVLDMDLFLYLNSVVVAVAAAADNLYLYRIMMVLDDLLWSSAPMSAAACWPC